MIKDLTYLIKTIITSISFYYIIYLIALLKNNINNQI